MREIKFRAWNPNAKAFQGYAGGHIHMHLHEAGALAASPLVFRFQQYTGLKDKNGKEIYEGDIVRLSDNPIHEGTMVKCLYSEEYAGYYYEFVTGEYKGKMTDMVDSWRKYEVIGNIHENPELLEGKS